MKKFAMLAGAAVALAGLVLGPASLISHWGATRELVRERVEAMSPDAEAAARIRVLLADMDDKILEYAQKLADVADRRDAAQRAAARIDSRLQSEKVVLQKAQGVLDQARDIVQVGNRSYTREQVTSDAVARLRFCQQLTKEQEFQKQLAEQLRQAAAEGEANLAKARSARTSKAAELQSLEARLLNAGLLQQVNELTAELRDAPLGPRTELGQAFSSFEKRVRAVELQADFTSAESKQGLVIDWQGDKDQGLEARREIARFLEHGIAEHEALEQAPQADVQRPEAAPTVQETAAATEETP